MQEEEGPPPSDQLAAPISVRMPPLGSSSASAGNGFDEIAVERDSGGGSPAGNRWPRQETMALLKIRSDMDPLFQEATLKAPLWEEVSRKLAEEGYERSAKKCKEKFENVFKYYKRTKEGRAGKSYRFFSQLDALRSSSSSSVAGGALPLPPSIASSSATMVNIEGSSSGAAAAPSPHTLLSVPAPAVRSGATTTTIPPPPPPRPPTDAADGGPSSSSNTSSYSGTESEEDEEDGTHRRKRKRDRPEARSGKMMTFFQGLIKEVMDQQETMLERFLEAIERREQNRMIREEAWRRQEKSRISREHELAAQDRAAAASRDDAIISFLQKLTGQKIPFPPPPPPNETTAEETPPSPPPPRPEDPDQPPKETTYLLGSNSSTIRTIEPILTLMSSSSRWPKSQVQALINLRSGMESKYMESSIPKGPLWEEISACMGRLGYNRSAKRCKEKWENINKYYKKVKESNKNRPEDAKTCPYFHQLDALYRAKILGGSSSAGTADQTLSTHDHQLAIISPTKQQDDDSLGFFEQAGSSSASLVKKPEDIVKKTIEQAVVEPETKKMDITGLECLVVQLDRTTCRPYWSGRDRDLFLYFAFSIYIYIYITHN